MLKSELLAMQLLKSARIRQRHSWMRWLMQLMMATSKNVGDLPMRETGLLTGMLHLVTQHLLRLHVEVRLMQYHDYWPVALLSTLPQSASVLKRLFLRLLPQAILMSVLHF
mmetsp:Transcript_30985/g.95881  ORF Transcript_30985/g.95881 Transcript_30985/m.95881 type:complete len:111 (+) Transcript_30985:2745-3077(+)